MNYKRSKNEKFVEKIFLINCNSASLCENSAVISCSGIALNIVKHCNSTSLCENSAVISCSGIVLSNVKHLNAN